MRTFLVLALAVLAVSSAPDLASYTPARGEFPVQSGLAQGYLRYLDASGAERLLAYRYPEPLYGVRRLSTDSSDIANPLLKSALVPTYVGKTYVRTSDIGQLTEQSLRSFCEQRLQAIQTELAKLRATGQQPTEEMMTQLNLLQNIVETATDNSGIQSPEIQREREEHLRLWNEARLKVLQLEAEQLRSQGKQPAELQPMYSSDTLQTYAPGYEPVSLVRETPEQQKAREEHLRIYNEQVLRLQQLAAERVPVIVKQAEPYTPAQELSNAIPTPVETVTETSEVLRAKEEHLRLWQEARLRAEQAALYESKKPEQHGAIRPIEPTLKATIPSADIYQPSPVQDTPEVMRAREEHLKLIKEAQLKAAPYASEEPALANVQYLPPRTTDDAGHEAERISSEERLLEVERLREAERIKAEQRLAEAERLREAERIREEERLRETESIRETERLLEEKRLMETERLRLKLEDDRRAELERQAETQTKGDASIKQDVSLEQKDRRIFESTLTQQQAALPVAQSQVANTIILTDKHRNNPFLVRVASQAGGTYILGTQQPHTAPIAGSAYTAPINPQNPFLIRYTVQGTPAVPSKDYLPAIAPATATLPAIKSGTQLKPIVADPVANYAAGGINIKLDAETSLSELEKATREHFRAHEIALEQLRLANLNNPSKTNC